MAYMNDPRRLIAVLRAMSGVLSILPRIELQLQQRSPVSRPQEHNSCSSNDVSFALSLLRSALIAVRIRLLTHESRLASNRG